MNPDQPQPPRPEGCADYQECVLCEDGVAQLCLQPHTFQYGADPNGVDLSCWVWYYSCPKCGGAYTTPQYETSVDGRVKRYLETGE